MTPRPLDTLSRPYVRPHMPGHRAYIAPLLTNRRLSMRDTALAKEQS